MQCDFLSAFSVYWIPELCAMVFALFTHYSRSAWMCSVPLAHHAAIKGRLIISIPPSLTGECTRGACVLLKRTDLHACVPNNRFMSVLFCRTHSW